MSYRVRNPLYHVAACGCLAALLPSQFSEWHQWVALLSLWVLINVIDVDSYREGLAKGADIVAGGGQ